MTMDDITIKDLSGMDQVNIVRALRVNYPEMTYDADQLLPFLVSGISADDIAETLYCCADIRSYSDINRSHTTGSSTKRIKPYREYISRTGNRINISEKQFSQIYHALCGIALDGSSYRVAAESAELVSKLIRTVLPKDILVRGFWNLLLTGTFGSYEGIDPERGKLIRAAETIAVKKLKRKNMRWYDALCLLSIDKDSNDVEVENSIVYYTYTSKLVSPSDKTRTACIIEPSLFFVRKWLSDECVHDVSAVFVFRDPLIQQMLDYLLPKREMIHIVSLDEYRNMLLTGSASSTLFFSSHFSDTAVKSDIIQALIGQARSVHDLFLLDTDHFVSSPSSPIFTDLLSTDIKRIDLLPSGIIGSTRPMRKMLVTSSYGYSDNTGSSTIQIANHVLDTGGAYQIISTKALRISITREEFAQAKSIRQLFREQAFADLRKSDRTRRQPSDYYFSEEILFRYNLYQGKDNASVVVSARSYIIDGQRRLPLPETASYASLKNTVDIVGYLDREYAYKIKKRTQPKISIRTTIADKGRDIFAGKAITLKTYIYINPSIEDCMSEAEVHYVRNLMGSYLGEMHLSELKPDHLSSYIYDTYNTDSISAKAKAGVFMRIFAHAVASGQVKTNPAIDLLTDHRKRFEALDEIRTALSKQFLSVTEANRIFSVCYKKSSDDPAYLAVLIRLLTGLESNIICALRYGDFWISSDGRVCSVRIERQVSSDGKSFVPFKTVEKVRDIPVPGIIADMISAKRRSIRSQHPDISAEQLLCRPIIPGNDHVIDLTTSILSPAKINKLSRSLIKDLDIPSYMLPIPTNQYGVTDTDLSDYRNDIYKRTYRHYLVRATDLNLAEINYLLGLKAPDVDYRNYVDCSRANYRKQIRLAAAQESIASLFQGD